jgi:hypothetical protein
MLGRHRPFARAALIAGLVALSGQPRVREGALKERRKAHFRLRRIHLRATERTDGITPGLRDDAYYCLSRRIQYVASIVSSP